MWWEEHITEEILGMVELQQFCDTRLTCCDGKISAPRAVVALTHPSTIYLWSWNTLTV